MRLSWSGLSLRLKILTGFLALLVLFTLGSLAGWRGLKQVTAAQEKERGLAAFSQMTMDADIKALEYRILGQDSDAKAFGDKVAALEQGLGEFAAGLQGAQKEALERAGQQLGLYRAIFGKVAANKKARGEKAAHAAKVAQGLGFIVEGNFRKHISEQQNMAAIEGTQLSPNVVEMLALANRLAEQFQAGQVAEQEYLLYQKPEVLQKVEKAAKAVELALTDMKTMAGIVKTEAKAEDYESNIDKLAQANREYRTAVLGLFNLAKEEVALSQELLAQGKGIIGILKDLGGEIAGEVASVQAAAVWAMLGALLLSLLAGLVMAWWLARSLARPLQRAIDGLGDGADRVAAAADQISSAGQQMAQGASEQAASLEETAASLEELSSMTRRNAENADQADGLTREASQVITAANQSMGRLTGSMQEISAASQEISKIIKTIDEIAFQTNLLALNAAVEAARAGQYGAGFAVVADEVRNLAMRAAQAAKSTAGLIEGTVGKIKEGAELVELANRAFGQVAQSSGRVAELVAEIAAASAEQSQGLDQVNKAVAEMDKVTQRNAAGAEESAGAAGDLAHQAGNLRSMVAGLQALVAGGDQAAAAPQPPQEAETPLLPES